MKSLRQLFYEHEGRLIHKWDHYFEIYERYFEKYRGTAVNILEIGISHGGSLELWRKYFGPEANIFAVDINPECKKLEEEKTIVFIGSQSDPNFLKQISDQMPALDIIIDDGGHTMDQQKTTFNFLYSQLRSEGVYLVEDTHTSYWYEYHGGYKNRNSFIEFSKDLIDSLYEGHLENDVKIRADSLTRNVNSISFYDSVVVFEKMERKEPFHIQKGTETITPYIDETLKNVPLTRKIKRKLLGIKGSTFDKNNRGKV